MNKRIGKKALVWILAICLILSTVGVASAASTSFSDIKGHWAESTITSWMNQSLAFGYEDDTFRPDASINRQEFTALVNRSFGYVELGIIEFNDVTLTDWSYSDISKAVKAGYVSGYPDGTFLPNKEMSRQEVAVIIALILALETSDSSITFTDAIITPIWSKGAINAVLEQGIMAGFPDGSFRPLQSTTRAESIVIIDRALKVKAGLELGAPTLVPTPVSTPAEAPVDLGTAGNYVILAKAGISSVPSSIVTGNIGVSPIDSTAITGFSLTVDATNEFSISNQITGKVYASDYTSPTSSNLTTAISNMETAYADAAGRAVDYTELYVGDLSGQTLTAGVYKWGTSVMINTDVTIHGGANDVFIFQIAGGITQASGTHIILTGGAQAKNIFWQVADTVSIGTNAHFEGIVLSKTNITLSTNASINGRLLAQTAVTLDQSTVVAP